MNILTADQVLSLAEEITVPPRPARHPVWSWSEYGLLVRLTAWTGLRPGELGALRVGRVHLDEASIDADESVAEIGGSLVCGPPKTYARRRVPVPTDLIAEVADHLATRPRDSDALVVTAPDGGPLRHGNFCNRFYKPAVVRAGLDSMTRFHDLRHTARGPDDRRGSPPARREEPTWAPDGSGHGRPLRRPVPIPGSCPRGPPECQVPDSKDRQYPIAMARGSRDDARPGRSTERTSTKRPSDLGISAAPPAGLEPATSRLEGGRSVH